MGGEAKGGLHTGGRTQHRNSNVMERRGARVGLLGQPPTLARATMGRRSGPGALCLCAGSTTVFVGFFFFSPSVCQNVSQSEPSKTTLLPEGASDGFVNNFDRLKGEKKKKTSFQLFTFQKLSISIWRIQCVCPSPAITSQQTTQT